MARLYVFQILGVYGARINVEGDFQAEVNLHQFPGMPGGGMPGGGMQGGPGMPGGDFNMGGGGGAGGMDMSGMPGDMSGMPGDMSGMPAGGGMPGGGGAFPGMPSQEEMAQIERNILCGFTRNKDCCTNANGCCTRWTQEQREFHTQDFLDSRAEYCSAFTNHGYDCQDPNAVYTPPSGCTEEELSSDCLQNVQMMNQAGANLDEAMCHQAGPGEAEALARAAGGAAPAPAPAAGGGGAVPVQPAAAPVQPAAGGGAAGAAAAQPAAGGGAAAQGSAGGAGAAPTDPPAAAAQDDTAPAPPPAADGPAPSPGGAASNFPKLAVSVAALWRFIM